MNFVRGGLWALALTVALAPELSRYLADRQLYRATSLLYAVQANATGMESTRALDFVTSEALDAVRALPGDPRPWMLAGSARLIARNPAEAVDLYQRALRVEERPEIDLNLGRAYMMLGLREKASAVLLRAGWINPAIVTSLPEIARDPLVQAIAETEASLRSGRLKAPPPPPTAHPGPS